MRKAVFLSLLLLGAAACHSRGPSNHGGGVAGGNAVAVNFTPYSAVRSDPSTTSAIRFYEGDKTTLTKVGAQYVGELELDTSQPHFANPFSKRPDGNTLAARAAQEAAKVGATHYVLLESGVDVKEYQVTPAQEESEQVSGYDRNGVRHTNTVTTHHDAQSVRTETPRARFALFRVEPNRWNELPGALRPAALPPEPVGTTAITSGPQSSSAPR